MAIRYSIIDANSWEPVNIVHTGKGKAEWIQCPDTRQQCLAKYPHIRENGDIVGLHWAEKISSELACALEIPVQKVDLGLYNSTQVALCDRFTIGYQMKHGESIIDGAHTFFEIAERLNDDDIINRFLEMLVFDALIGNQDRHERNWGLLYKQNENIHPHSFAPLFDNATAFGVELLLNKVSYFLKRDKEVAQYITRGSHFFAGENRKRLRHLDTIKQIKKRFSKKAKELESKLKLLNNKIIEDIICGVPSSFMEEERKQLAFKLLILRRDSLLEGGE